MRRSSSAPGLTPAAAWRSSCVCTSLSSFTSCAVVVHRACGFRCQVPIPLHGASTSTPSNCRLRWQPRPAVPGYRAIIEDPGSRRPPLQLRQTPRGAIACPDQSLVLHQVRKVQRLAAFARARVPPLLPGSRIADQSDRLGADVLQFKFARVKFLGAKQIAAADGIPEYLPAGPRRRRGNHPVSPPLPCPVRAAPATKAWVPFAAPAPRRPSVPSPSAAKPAPPAPSALRR